MSHTIPIEQASNRLGELLRALSPGDEIILTDNEQPIARVVPTAAPRKRVAGTCEGMLTILHEDDEHLKDFKDYM